jgi:F-box-like
MTIDVFRRLPDDALREILYFHVDGSRSISEWHTLIHVCRRWREIVFDSPCRLKLQLECIPRKPLKKTLEVWPPLPMVINGEYYSKSSVDNIMAMLKHNDRVCGIRHGRA